MELKIDPEFEELIPPLTPEEYESLEKNIVENGYNPAFPIITWDGIVIDGHNRYKISKKHNVEPVTIAQEFPSRSAALMWIIDNQLARRNINGRLEIIFLERGIVRKRNHMVEIENQVLKMST